MALHFSLRGFHDKEKRDEEERLAAIKAKEELAARDATVASFCASSTQRWWVVNVVKPTTASVHAWGRMRR